MKVKNFNNFFFQFIDQKFNLYQLNKLKLYFVINNFRKLNNDLLNSVN